MSYNSNARKKKTVSISAINEHAYKVFPNDLNHNGTVFGGLVMSILDRTALIVAERHSEQVCVTVSVDALHFLAPATGGDVLIFKAAINRSWNTSMEIGVKVMMEDYHTGQSKHLLSAYFTFVALDANGHSIEVPEVIPETLEEKHRFKEAEWRRAHRISQSKERKKLRDQL